GLVGLPLGAVAPVLLGELVLFVGRLLAIAKARQLLVGGDVQPELLHQAARLRQLLLEVVDLAVGALPLARAAETFDALDQHAPVPGSIVDADATFARQMAPEAPQVGARALLVGGRGDRNHLVVARVHRLDEAADGAALAGGVGTLEYE